MGYEAWGAKPLEEHALASDTGSKNVGEGSFVELRGGAISGGKLRWYSQGLQTPEVA
jgi:hypothetical protein